MLAAAERTIRSLTLTLLFFVALLAGPLPADDEPTNVEDLYAPFYAAALRHAAAEVPGCKPDRPCCFSVGGENPPRELVDELSDVPDLTPLAIPDGCAFSDLDVLHVESSKPGLYATYITFGPNVLHCKYFLRLTDRGWVVVPSETECRID